MRAVVTPKTRRDTSAVTACGGSGTASSVWVGGSLSSFCPAVISPLDTAIAATRANNRAEVIRLCFKIVAGKGVIRKEGDLVGKAIPLWYGTSRQCFTGPISMRALASRSTGNCTSVSGKTLDLDIFWKVAACPPAASLPSNLD